VLACLRAGAIWRGHSIAAQVGISYSQAMVCCRQLADDGLIERVTGDDLGTLRELSDGRRVWFGPESGAVGWRIRSVNDDELRMLEDLWNKESHSGQ